MKVMRQTAPVTFIAGTITPGASYVCSDADRDRFLASAEATDTARVITRPTGEAKPLSRSSVEAGGWSSRQQAAMRRLRQLWHAAKIERVQPHGYPTEVCQPYTPAGEDTHTPEQVAAATLAYRQYQQAMSDVGQRCSDGHAYWLRQAAHEEAVPLGAAHLVREALNWLADDWRLK
jgi:membrane-bound lytic murein transglycosylase B